MTLLDRYLAGEHEPVWADIRAAAPDVDDVVVEQVAHETARRARIQIEEIVAGFREAGLNPAFDFPLLVTPPTDVRERITEVESLTGRLPAILRASVIEIGNVCLTGDSKALGLFYNEYRPVSSSPPSADYPDPLCLPGIEVIEFESEAAIEMAQLDESGPPYELVIAPDEYHKANISGGAQVLSVDAAFPDPVIEGIHGRRGITYLQYLRVAVAWGGLPGYEFGEAPAALAGLRRTPNF